LIEEEGMFSLAVYLGIQYPPPEGELKGEDYTMSCPKIGLHKK
jgi:hypothetical protein